MDNFEFYPVYIVGPTGVGKSKLAFLISRRLPVEIVSCDSMQVYKGMDIGTDKPPPRMRRSVPHHMIDIVDVREEYNVFRYVKEARRCIKDILTRRKYPLIVGGTGLYYRALVDGIFEGAGKDEGIRKRLEDRIRDEGLGNLYLELQMVDPVSASRISLRDKKRIIRALEVFYLTGKPISSFRTSWGNKKKACVIGITTDRERLYNRINRRVERMFEDGLVEEVRGLMESGLEENRTAIQALGYKEVVRYLKGGCTLDECIEEVKKNTRAFARRQLTWFRKDDRVKWFWIEDDVTEVEEKVIEYLAGWGR